MKGQSWIFTFPASSRVSGGGSDKKPVVYDCVQSSSKKIVGYKSILSGGAYFLRLCILCRLKYLSDNQFLDAYNPDQSLSVRIVDCNTRRKRHVSNKKYLFSARSLFMNLWINYKVNFQQRWAEWDEQNAQNGMSGQPCTQIPVRAHKTGSGMYIVPISFE